MGSRLRRLDDLEKRTGKTKETPEYVIVGKDGTLPEGADPEKAKTVVRLNLNLDDV